MILYLFFTFILSLLTEMVIQLSVEKAMASSATDTKLNIVAKAKVIALQKPILARGKRFRLFPKKILTKHHQGGRGGCAI